MQIIHRRGGKFALLFEPLELKLLALYRVQLKNSEVKDDATLLAAMFQQQIDFMHSCLQGDAEPNLLGVPSSIPKVSLN